MSIEKEIKDIINNAMASHSQSKEVEDLREKVEELTQQVKRLSQAREADMNAIQSSILNIKQGEVFISPATISGEISCSRKSLDKELQKALIETINQQAQFKGSPLWNAINGYRAGNWESKSDPRLMEVSKRNEVSEIDDKVKNYSSGMAKTTSVDFQIVDGKGQMICRMERPSDHELSEEIKQPSTYDVDAKLKFIAVLMPTELLKSI